MNFNLDSKGPVLEWDGAGWVEVKPSAPEKNEVETIQLGELDPEHRLALARGEEIRLSGQQFEGFEKSLTDSPASENQALQDLLVREPRWGSDK